MHVQSNVLLVQKLLEFVLTFLKLSNEISRIGYNFPFYSFLIHYFKKNNVQCYRERLHQ